MASSSLFSPAPYHIISYGTLLGTTFFHTFIGGIVSFQVLARPQFSILMTKIFPIYFSMQTALPAVLALTYPASRWGGGLSGIAGVLEPVNRWSVLVPIATIFATGLANLVVVGPATTECMDERKVQERKDGKKSYDSPPHSQEMTALNKKFSILHGASSLLNVASFVATVAYGFTLASRLE
ncbi:hypothetical protein B0T22DRAFT_16221 [Podospora appendiculata]|uniref:TMEM205-like domain-containing protein n=1 Tax=Podospora appendiculata TaxID=314037 RepID=A0AAE1CFJ7_9PEZI|nr:hypothetical protein B0T22DRAFT_16221 [Podospora appendiculata]